MPPGDLALLPSLRTSYSTPRSRVRATPMPMPSKRGVHEACCGHDRVCTTPGVHDVPRTIDSRDSRSGPCPSVSDELRHLEAHRTHRSDGKPADAFRHKRKAVSLCGRQTAGRILFSRKNERKQCAQFGVARHPSPGPGLTLHSRRFEGSPSGLPAGKRQSGKSGRSKSVADTSTLARCQHDGAHS